MGKVEIQQLLQRLVQAIISTISDRLTKATLQPQYMRYSRWKVTEFEYDDTGFKKLNRQSGEFLKPIWPKATREVWQKVIKLDIYSDTYKTIAEDYNLREGQINDYLHQLITRLAVSILECKVETMANTTKYIDSFLKDLNGEEQACRAVVQLKGLILQPNSIQLDDTTRLRKPNRKDFETEELAYFSPWGERDPTAFLHVAGYAKAETSPRVLRNEIDKAVAILRLFRVGAVEDMRHSETTDSVIGFTASGLARGKLLGSPDKYLITIRDAKVLKKFWANMKKVSLPDSAYSVLQKESDALSIAYQRYTDSLDTHLLEKRISSAVMGLEALYLKPEERQELTYRLSMRASKLLSQIGYPAEEVRKNLIHAYDIRSTYVHGKILSLKKKKEHEKQVGDLNKFPKVIMDYLRASIVTLLKMRSKEILIQKIDDSFLDNKKEEEVKKLLFTPYN